MPINPSTWPGVGPVTAAQLNKDLYSYQPGNVFFPNGILFHATPPLVATWMSGKPGTAQPQSSSSAGSYTQASGAISGIQAWLAELDNNAIRASLTSAVGSPYIGFWTTVYNGAGGSATAPLGSAYYLFWVITSFASTLNAGASGSALVNASSGSFLNTIGGIQRSSTTRLNGSYTVDLQSSAGPSTGLFGAAGYCADVSGSTFAYSANGTDYMGAACQFGGIWAAPMTNQGVTVPSSLPVPFTGYTAGTVVTAAMLNGSALAAPLAFLNNPPAFQAAASLATSIPTSAALSSTLVPLGNSATLDNWGKWTSGSSTWTAPVSGVYLVHGSVEFTASTAGSRAAGIRINGTLTLWGPGHQAAGTGVTRPQVLRLVDLNAGDTVTLVASQSSGGALSLASVQGQCRLVIKFMCALAGSNGSVSWTPPATGFRWQAGTPGSQLPALFQQHLANDLSFLIQRPYLLSYQSAAQSALADNTWQIITTNTLGGRVHASAGDNYGGWTSGASNRYAAKVPGWYLAIANYTQVSPGSTASCLAGIGYFTSGAVAQGSSAQQQGQQVRNGVSSSDYAAGAEAIGLFYLNVGDYLQPYYQQQDGPATFATSVAVAGQESSFSCVWVSE